MILRVRNTVSGQNGGSNGKAIAISLAAEIGTDQTIAKFWRWWLRRARLGRRQRRIGLYHDGFIRPFHPFAVLLFTLKAEKDAGLAAPVCLKHRHVQCERFGLHVAALQKSLRTGKSRGQRIAMGIPEYFRIPRISPNDRLGFMLERVVILVWFIMLQTDDGWFCLLGTFAVEKIGPERPAQEAEADENYQAADGPHPALPAPASGSVCGTQ